MERGQTLPRTVSVSSTLTFDMIPAGEAYWFAMGKRLGKIVRDRMEAEGMSARGVSRASGGLVSHTTVTSAANGLPNKTFENRTLHALASALGLPAREIVAAYDADLAEAKPIRLVLPAEAEHLSVAGRAALLAHLKWLLEQERQVGAERLKRGRRPSS